jgi:hypothetical protein
MPSTLARMRFLTFQPLIPPALWVLIALACAGSWIWYGSRRPVDLSRGRWAAIVGLTSGGVGAILVILLNPTWLERIQPPGGKAVLSVLVDASASMDTPDAGSGTTRFVSAETLAQGLASTLGDQFEVRTIAFAGSTKGVDPQALARVRPDGPITDVAGAIAASLVEDQPRGQSIVLLSDGIHNAGGQAARVLESVRLARGLNAPIYTKTLGGQVEVNDLALDLESQQELAFIGQQAPLVARVRRRGSGVSRPSVILSFQGRELARRPATFDAQGRAEVRFDVQQPQPGLYRHEVRVEPAPGEVILANNAASFLLRVVGEPIRVLILEGKPYWDNKFLTRTLSSDPSIELDSVVRIAENRFLRRALSRPKAADKETAAKEALRVDDWKVLSGPDEIMARPDGLGRYQIVVLGRDADVFLGDERLGRLREWIARDGGALVCYRGAPAAQVSQPLARLLPVRWSRSAESRFRVQLTERGQELHWLPSADAGPASEVLARLPTLARNEQPHEPKPLAVVLATSTVTAGAGGSAIPVVTYQPYGSGRVVVIEGAGMWRWAFLPPQYRDQADTYGSLWHSLVRWLASGTGLPPGRDMALHADKVAFRTNEPVTATLLVRQALAKSAIPKINLEGDAPNASKSFTPVATGDEPGTFRVLFGTLPQGRYRARIGGTGNGDSTAASSSEIAFDVRELEDERLDLAARGDLMARIAQESGGAVLATGSPSELVVQIQAARDRSRTEQVLRYPAWDRWWVLVSIIAFFGTAWMLRRSAGLV